MFGVVPKVIWNRVAPADDRNRIQLAMNCLLIEGNGQRVLVDAGVGTKDDPKFRDIFAVEHPESLIEDLAAIGVAPADITTVAYTHLHFDHCGGGTTKGEDGAVRPTFPGAHYLVRRQEWEDATHANERTRASYRSQNFVAIEQAGQLVLHDDDIEILPGVTMRALPGHTRGHQGVFFDLPESRALYCADLLPTVGHLPLPFVMGFDVFPLTTLETKRSIFRDAIRQNWLLLLEHDPDHLAIRISGAEDKAHFEKVA
jgi:glyoxylase-like metal-dependent hydrolase (beta-lactamase superfamily II)